MTKKKSRDRAHAPTGPTVAAREQRRSWRPRLEHAFLVAALVWIAWIPYSDSLAAGFVYDSETIVLLDRRLQNPAAASPFSGEIWTSHYWYPQVAFYNVHYRPLVTLSYALNYWPSGYAALPSAQQRAFRGALAGWDLAAAPTLPVLDERGWREAQVSYHAINWLYHVANVLLVYTLALLLLNMSRPPPWPSSGARFIAFAAASLFASHPVFTEAVTNIVGRADMQASLFVLLGFLAHLRGRVAAGRRDALWMSLSAVALLLGLLTKESAIVLVGLAALYDLVLADYAPVRAERRPISRVRVFVPYLLFAIATAIYVITRSAVLRAFDPSFPSGLDNPLLDYGFVASKLTALKALGVQIALLMWPVRLSADYSFDAIPVVGGAAGSAWGVVGPLLIAAALLGIGAIAWRLRRQHPLVLFLFLAILGCLAPTSNLFVETGTIMAERLLYLPGVWFCLALALGAGHLAMRANAWQPRLSVSFAIAAGTLLVAAATWMVWWPALPGWLVPGVTRLVRLNPGLTAAGLIAAWILPAVVGLVLLRDQIQASAAWTSRAGIAAVAVLVGGLVQLGSVRTFARNLDWQSDLSLWTSGIDVMPASARTHDLYAKALLNRPFVSDSVLADAIRHAERAWSIRREAVMGASLGMMYLQRAERVRDAAMARDVAPAEMDRMIQRLRPQYEAAVDTLLGALGEERRLVNAMHARLEERGRPLYESKSHGIPDLYVTLGLALMRLNRLEDAVAVLEHAVDLEPYDVGSRRALSDALIELAMQQPQRRAELLRRAAVELVQILFFDNREIAAARRLAFVYSLLLPGQRILNVEPMASAAGEARRSTASADPAAAEMLATPPPVHDDICAALLSTVTRFGGVGEHASARSARTEAVDGYACDAQPFDAVMATPSIPTLAWSPPPR